MRRNKKRLSIAKRIAVFITTETVRPIGISLALFRLMTGHKKKFPPSKRAIARKLAFCEKADTSSISGWFAETIIQNEWVMQATHLLYEYAVKSPFAACNVLSSISIR